MSAKATAETRLHIDWTRCDGHGTCADLLPDLIARDDWGFPILITGRPMRRQVRERAELAVEVCPMLALKIVGTPRS